MVSLKCLKMLNKELKIFCKIMDYRKFYQEVTGELIPKCFDVHHIDFNRENNSIENLVSIPKELHQAYHKTYSCLCMDSFSKDFLKPQGIIDGGSRALFYTAEMLNNHLVNHSKVQDWIDYKYYLLGYLPNVHNLKY